MKNKIEDINKVDKNKEQKFQDTLEGKNRRRKKQKTAGFFLILSFLLFVFMILTNVINIGLTPKLTTMGGGAFVSAENFDSSLYYNTTMVNLLFVTYNNATSNVNLTGHNLTADNFFGYLNHSWIQNSPSYLLTSDQIYNETNLINSNNASWSSTYNATYDAKVTDNQSWNATALNNYYNVSQVFNNTAYNSTQMSNSGGVLNILVSWLTSLFYQKSEVYNKTEIDNNFSLYRTLTNGTFNVNINASGYNITANMYITKTINGELYGYCTNSTGTSFLGNLSTGAICSQ